VGEVMTSIEAYKHEIKTGNRVIDSEVFSGVTYHVNADYIGIDAGDSGRLAVKKCDLENLIKEFWEVYSTFCKYE
jgi:hypothetical protein